MDEPAMTISAVADRTGVPQATLRAWQNRYGLAPSRTTEGGHRRYTAEDLSRIRSVQRLVARGVSAGDAARSVLSGAAHTEVTLELPAGSERAAHLVADAALDLDGPRVRSLLREQFVRYGVLATWEDVIRPVLGAVGRRWEELPHGVAVEHLVSHLATIALGESSRRRPCSGDRTVLLACAPGEGHELPMTALAAALDVTRVTPNLLGARTPATALSEAAALRRPAVVVVFALLPQYADPELFAGLPASSRRIAAGPGWEPGTLPDEVSSVDDLLGATELVTSLV